MSDIAINLNGVIGWMAAMTCTCISFMLVLFFIIQRKKYTHAKRKILYFTGLCICFPLLSYGPFTLQKFNPGIPWLLYSDYSIPLICFVALIIGFIKKKRRENAGE
jgi:hypothetical protein